jgi:hypothetical protein
MAHLQLLRPGGRLDGAVLHVRPWRDDVVDRAGFDPRSAYAEDFWLPVLGPSSAPPAPIHSDQDNCVSTRLPWPPAAGAWFH